MRFKKSLLPRGISGSRRRVTSQLQHRCRAETLAGFGKDLMK